jgi:hypothetical protein
VPVEEDAEVKEDRIQAVEADATSFTVFRACVGSSSVDGERARGLPLLRVVGAMMRSWLLDRIFRAVGRVRSAIFSPSVSQHFQAVAGLDNANVYRYSMILNLISTAVLIVLIKVGSPHFAEWPT